MTRSARLFCTRSGPDGSVKLFYQASAHAVTVYTARPKISLILYGVSVSRAWLYLLLAIVSEISSVVVMKLISKNVSLTGMIIMYLTIGLSFTFMALALKKITLAVAYATWESLGLLAIAIIGSIFFKEHLSMIQLTGIMFLLGGVILVNTAENEQGN